MSSHNSALEFVANKKLLDLEWRFAIATANSSRPLYGDCFLQLKLKTCDKNMVEETTHLELTLAQFNEFYLEIEKIKTLMEIIK